MILIEQFHEKSSSWWLKSIWKYHKDERIAVAAHMTLLGNYIGDKDAFSLENVYFHILKKCWGDLATESYEVVDFYFKFSENQIIYKLYDIKTHSPHMKHVRYDIETELRQTIEVWSTHQK